jgi:hypothetical protein
MKIEQQLARHMLAHKERDYSIGYILRQSMWRYVAMIVVAAAMFGVFSCARAPMIKYCFMCYFGMALGTMLRDFAWFIKLSRQWPFTRSIINWQMVEAIAEGNLAEQCRRP